MSRNYSASQYEKTFTPKRLQMYQVPRDPQPGVVSTREKKQIVDREYILKIQSKQLLPSISFPREKF